MNESKGRQFLSIAVASFFTCWASPLFCQTYYDESQVHSYILKIGTPGFSSGWNMKINSAMLSYTITNPVFPQGLITGFSTVIYSDPYADGTIEIEHFSRLNPYAGPLRELGGNASLRYFTTGTGESRRASIWLNQGDISVNPTHFSKANFGRTDVTRGYVKIDYLQSGGGTDPVPVYDFWVKVPSWNLYAAKTSDTKFFPLTSMGISSQQIVAMNASIYSDPNASGEVDVDQWNRTSSHSAAGQAYPYGGRGGTLASWSSGIGLVMGPVDGAHQLNINRFKDINWSSTTAKRGWVKISYIGTKSANAQPYAVKTKVRSLDNWDMNTSSNEYPIVFSSLGIKSDRIMNFQTIVRSDLNSSYTIYSDFHRINFGGSQSGTKYSESGGETTIGGKANFVRFHHIGEFFKDRIPPPSTDWFDYPANYSNISSYNRGYLSLDYLAGTCVQGLAGFTIQAVPGTRPNACIAGPSGNAIFEGAGNDIWNNSDDFAFAFKTASGDRDLSLKVETQGNTSGWAKVGIMFRVSLSANSKEASMLLTPSNGGQFTWRPDNSSSTSRTSDNQTIKAKAPYYIRISKVGNTFTAYYRQTTTAAWALVGSQTITAFGGAATQYYYGLAQSSNSPAMNVTTLSNFSGF